MNFPKLQTFIDPEMQTCIYWNKSQAIVILESGFLINLENMNQS